MDGEKRNGREQERGSGDGEEKLGHETAFAQKHGGEETQPEEDRQSEANWKRRGETDGNGTSSNETKGSRERKAPKRERGTTMEEGGMERKRDDGWEAAGTKEETPKEVIERWGNAARIHERECQKEEQRERRDSEKTKRTLGASAEKGENAEREKDDGVIGRAGSDEFFPGVGNALSFASCASIQRKNESEQNRETAKADPTTKTVKQGPREESEDQITDDATEPGGGTDTAAQGDYGDTRGKRREGRGEAQRQEAVETCEEEGERDAKGMREANRHRDGTSAEQDVEERDEGTGKNERAEVQCESTEQERPKSAQEKADEENAEGIGETEREPEAPGSGGGAQWQSERDARTIISALDQEKTEETQRRRNNSRTNISSADETATPNVLSSFPVTLISSSRHTITQSCPPFRRQTSASTKTEESNASPPAFPASASSLFASSSDSSLSRSVPSSLRPASCPPSSTPSLNSVSCSLIPCSPISSLPTSSDSSLPPNTLALPGASPALEVPQERPRPALSCSLEATREQSPFVIRSSPRSHAPFSPCPSASGPVSRSDSPRPSRSLPPSPISPSAASFPPSPDSPLREQRGPSEGSAIPEKASCAETGDARGDAGEKPNAGEKEVTDQGARATDSTNKENEKAQSQGKETDHGARTVARQELLSPESEAIEQSSSDLSPSQKREGQAREDAIDATSAEGKERKARSEGSALTRNEGSARISDNSDNRETAREEDGEREEQETAAFCEEVREREPAERQRKREDASHSSGADPVGVLRGQGATVARQTKDGVASAGEGRHAGAEETGAKGKETASEVAEGLGPFEEPSEAAEREAAGEAAVDTGDPGKERKDGEAEEQAEGGDPELPEAERVRVPSSCGDDENQEPSLGEKFWEAQESPSRQREVLYDERRGSASAVEQYKSVDPEMTTPELQRSEEEKHGPSCLLSTEQAPSLVLPRRENLSLLSCQSSLDLAISLEGISALTAGAQNTVLASESRSPLPSLPYYGLASSPVPSIAEPRPASWSRFACSPARALETLPLPAASFAPSESRSAASSVAPEAAEAPPAKGEKHGDQKEEIDDASSEERRPDERARDEEDRFGDASRKQRDDLPLSLSEAPRVERAPGLPVEPKSVGRSGPLSASCVRPSVLTFSESLAASAGPPRPSFTFVSTFSPSSPVTLSDMLASPASPPPGSCLFLRDSRRPRDSPATCGRPELPAPQWAEDAQLQEEDRGEDGREQEANSEERGETRRNSSGASGEERSGKEGDRRDFEPAHEGDNDRSKGGTESRDQEACAEVELAIEELKQVEKLDEEVDAKSDDETSRPVDDTVEQPGGEGKSCFSSPRGRRLFTKSGRMKSSKYFLGPSSGSRSRRLGPRMRRPSFARVPKALPSERRSGSARTRREGLREWEATRGCREKAEACEPGEGETAYENPESACASKSEEERNREDAEAAAENATGKKYEIEVGDHEEGKARPVARRQPGDETVETKDSGRLSERPVELRSSAAPSRVHGGEGRREARERTEKSEKPIAGDAEDAQTAGCPSAASRAVDPVRGEGLGPRTKKVLWCESGDKKPGRERGGHRPGEGRSGGARETREGDSLPCASLRVLPESRDGTEEERGWREDRERRQELLPPEESTRSAWRPEESRARARRRTGAPWDSPTPPRGAADAAGDQRARREAKTSSRQKSGANAEKRGTETGSGAERRPDTKRAVSDNSEKTLSADCRGAGVLERSRASPHVRFPFVTAELSGVFEYFFTGTGGMGTRAAQ
uniref:Uncharacterized protein n=1 Tax=Neospora caninum (strain Liverpool) TaxID=572307 RepID=A0A0F7UDV0_NEOCL|nr:TPA: hypothetical protein BN1204_038021 [Neospora caninum Liverpool]